MPGRWSGCQDLQIEPHGEMYPRTTLINNAPDPGAPAVKSL